MIAVADTSPICYLILIGEVDLLPELFHQVLTPPAVIAELQHEDAPEMVRDWASRLLMRQTSFRSSPALLKTTLDRFGPR